MQVTFTKKCFLFSFLLCPLILLLGFLTPVQADFVLNALHVTVTEPVAGDTPVFTVTGFPSSRYTAEVEVWGIQGTNSIITKKNMGDYVYSADRTYVCNVSITLKSGTTLNSPIAEENLTINNNKATLTKNGTQSYILSCPFPAKKLDISTCTATVSPDSLTYYRGEERRPSQVVVTNKGKGKTLQQGKDYTLSYSYNRNPGTAYVDIHGINNYTGSLSASYTIKEATLPSSTNVTISGGTKAGGTFVCVVNTLPSSCTYSDEVYNWCYSPDNVNWSTIGEISGKSGTIPEKYAGGYVYVRFYARGHSGFADSKTIRLDPPASAPDPGISDTPVPPPAASAPVPQINIPANIPTAQQTPAANANPKKSAKPIAYNIKKKSFRIRYPKVSKVTGYQIYISQNKKFTKARKVFYTKKTTFLLSKLKPGKTYYVKVRAYTGKTAKKRKFKKFSPVTTVKLPR